MMAQDISESAYDLFKTRMFRSTEAYIIYYNIRLYLQDNVLEGLE